jgi:hypothetical protein
MSRASAIRCAVVALAVAGGATPVPAHAQSKTGTTIGQFLLIEPSARVTGMGNAGVSLRDGLDAAYYNPAAVASVEGYELVFAHSEWLADIRYDYAALAIPMGRFGIAYGTVTSLGSGDIDVRTVDQPLGTGERYSVNDIAFGFGVGRAITDRFSVGGQIQFMQETIWHSTVSAMSLNLGTLYKISDNGLHIGSSLGNFGTQASYDGRDLRILYDNDPDRFGDNGALPGVRFTDPFALPVMFRVGLGWPVRIDPVNQLQLAVDALHPSDNSESVSMGAEWAYREAVALRLGYQNLFLEDSEVGLTFGAGVGGKLDVYRYRLDYAWADHGRLGSTQRFSLDLDF